MNNLLYIGLNGYAGSGKDTVAKMLYCILNYDWTNKEECKDRFKREYATHIRPYATLKETNDQDNKCTCIAFADRLKVICSAMFGVPISYFYYNKNRAWICINKDFEYTETCPQEEFIVTADDYHSCKDSYMYSSNRYYMSLREILVYVGTYVCQRTICENVFVNSVSNNINNIVWEPEYSNLKYVICTDVRFVHEYNFIKENNGIMINIVRDDVAQAADIAEHDLDMMDRESYHHVIYNNGTYDDLFDAVWNMVHDNIEFENVTIPLVSRVHTNNSYLRILKVNKTNESELTLCRLCNTVDVNRASYSEGKIVSIDLEGGPQIFVGELVYGTPKYVDAIWFDEEKSEYLICLKS